MRRPTLAYLGFCLTLPWALVHCGSKSSDDDAAGNGSGGSSGNATGAAAGKPGTGGSTGGSTMGGAGGSTGGTGGSTGGTGGSTGGTGGTGGSTGGTGGSTGGTGGSGGSTGGAGGMAGSTSGSAGMGGSGGTAGSAAGSAGMPAGGAAGCAATDMSGKMNWTPGAMTSTTRDYLRSCDIRLINNNWGAVALGCSADKNQYNVFVNQDGSLGWNFKRGDCDTQAKNQNPDFPEIEFGVHPFGMTMDNGTRLATSPDFSSTTLLPIQIKSITSASVTVNNLNIQLTQSENWDITFEFWISQKNPLTESDPGVYAEIMTFWGWENGRWPECSPPTTGCNGPTGTGAGDQVTAGNKSYKLEVQSDTWANGKWRYFQFRMTDGPATNFSGKLDVKPLIDYVVQKRGYSTDYWISRFEVGSEIDDNTAGKVTLDSITFEVNGQSRTAGKM